MRKALKITLIVIGIATAALLLLILAKFGDTAPPTRILEPATVAPSDPRGSAPPGTSGSRARVTLPDLVYFGAAWQLLNKRTGMAPIVLGGGYTNARVERTGDGLFFAGIVDRVDARGAVTDVVLAFAGAQGVGDFIQGSSLGHGEGRVEPKWAAVLFERIWADPRYAAARIHVTGHSLGAGYAQFVGTEAIARHGSEAVAKRVSIVAFGVPNWGSQIAQHFHVGPDVLDGIFTGYTALNDPVISNGGTDRVGISNFLPPFDKLTGLASIANAVAAHWPTTYMKALGLPDWLTPEQKSAAIWTVSDAFFTGRSYDVGYGLSADATLVVQGSAGGDTIHGTARDDLIAGMGGRDVLRGGGGNDRFLILQPSDSGPTPGAADEILDFTPGDRIDLCRMDADKTRSGRQAFTFVPRRSFSVPGQVASWTADGATWIAGNVDADLAADFLIRIRGARHLSAADFVLTPLPRDRKFDAFVRGKAAIFNQH